MSLFKRFPSYDQIARGAAASAARFPLTLLSALVGVVAAMILVGPDHSTDHPALQKLLVCAALGLPLFIALTTFAEKRLRSRAGRLLLQAAGVALLAAYYFSLPEKINEPMHNMVRFALLFIGLHFLVAWLPWTGKDQLVGFWQYNKALFLRFLISGLYSAVLFLGLALALAAIDNLFGAEIEPETYFRLWITIVGLFLTWVFLAGLPKDLTALNGSDEYPAGLKAFTQFILLPLVGLYFAILIVYEAKIIITWNWPKGWVSELVLWYSVVGILSFLLLQPLRDQLQSRWIQTISKWFYRGLIPLVAMLFLAILRRISEYGVTENRYLVLGMAIGLTIVMLYMITSRRKDIRLIPILICLLAFFSTYGPWSAFAVSRASQQDRLERLMVHSGLLVNGVLAKPEVEPPVEDRQEMSSVVYYLGEMHGTDAFSDWLPDSTLRVLDPLPQYGRAEQITERLGFDYVSPTLLPAEGGSVRLTMGDAIAVDGYDMILPFETMSPWILSRVYTLEKDTDTCLLKFDTAAVSLTLRFSRAGADTGVVAVIALKEPLTALLDNATTEELASQDLTFQATGADTTVRVVLQMVNCHRTDDGIQVNSMNGFLLLRRQQ